MKRRLLLLFCFVIALAHCDFDNPATEKPTRDVDARLLGKWRTKDEVLEVTKSSDTMYGVLQTTNKDGQSNTSNYRAYHSDVAGFSLLTVKAHVHAGDAPYIYAVCQLSADGKTMTLRTVSTKAIPRGISTDDLPLLLKKHKDDSNLFEEVAKYERVNP